MEEEESGKVAFTGIWIVRPRGRISRRRRSGQVPRARKDRGRRQRQQQARRRSCSRFLGPFCAQLPDLPTLRVCTYLPTTYPPYYLTPNSVWVCLYRLYPKTQIISTSRWVLFDQRASSSSLFSEVPTSFPDETNCRWSLNNSSRLVHCCLKIPII